MSIQVDCPCGKRLKARDEAAGKRVRCPTCGNPVTVPSPNTLDQGIDLVGGNPFVNPDWVKPEPQVPTTRRAQPQSVFPHLDLGDDGLNGNIVAKPQPSDTGKGGRPSVASTTKTCPFCGEDILAVAKKCKHCNELLDPSLKQAREVPKWNSGIAGLLSLIMPGLGQMYKGQVGLGMIQVLGWLAAVGILGYAGLVFNIGSFLHAVFAKPKKMEAGKKPKSVFATMLICLLVLSFLVGAVAVMVWQKQMRDERRMHENNMRDALRQSDDAINRYLGR